MDFKSYRNNVIYSRTFVDYYFKTNVDVRQQNDPA